MPGKMIIPGRTFCPFTKELCDENCAMYLLGKGCLISNAMDTLSSITKKKLIHSWRRSNERIFANC